MVVGAQFLTTPKRINFLWVSALPKTILFIKYLSLIDIRLICVYSYSDIVNKILKTRIARNCQKQHIDLISINRVYIIYTVVIKSDRLRSLLDERDSLSPDSVALSITQRFGSRQILLVLSYIILKYSTQRITISACQSELCQQLNHFMW